MDNDRVEQTIELRAPRSRVWRAISNGKDFGTWFGLGEPLTLEGDFVPGAKITGVWGSGASQVRELFCTIDKVEPERALSFRWVPYEIPPGDDPAKHPTTCIEFRLDDIEIGTRLTVVESGFSKLPADKQYTRERNGRGWAGQVHAIAAHLLGGVTVRVEDQIARPVADVFEAIVDPAKMAQYFISRGSGRIAAGATLEWEWADVGAKLKIDVAQLEPNSKIGFAWAATGLQTKVTLAVTPDGPDGNATKITATEAPFSLTEEGVARAMQQTQGWTDFCCSLKAYLVHGINLRLGKPADHVA
ncbi:MAG TPA: SRPBCC domain-containing protein [Kofleriaceae bacterium]